MSDRVAVQLERVATLLAVGRPWQQKLVDFDREGFPTGLALVTGTDEDTAR